MYGLFFVGSPSCKSSLTFLLEFSWKKFSFLLGNGASFTFLNPFLLVEREVVNLTVGLEEKEFFHINTSPGLPKVNL